MTTSRVPRYPILIALLLLLIVAAGAWRFRGDLDGVAVIGKYFAPSTDPASAPPASPGAPATSVGPAAASGETGGGVTIDLRRQQLIGLRVAPVQRTSIAGSLRTTGVVRPDETRQTDVNVKLDGWIRDLWVDYTGQAVRRGERLFSLYSPDLLATQNEFLLALKSREQMQSSQVSEVREYADRLVQSARQRLALWDLSPEQIDTIERTHQPIEAVTFTSPATGTVLEKQALRGMHVTAGQMLYRIADLSVVWVEADVYEQEMPLVRVGQRATVTLDAYPGRAFAGRAIYVVPTVEEQTRTIRLRFQFDNPGGVLKPGMFANVELRGDEQQGLTVPANAVLDSGTQQTVFVAEGEGVFTPRRVKAGRRLGDAVEIREGLKEGEQVATSAAFFLDSESQLRSGLQNYEATPAPDSPSREPAARVDIAFRPTPDPPTTGTSTFEVTVKEASGQPVIGADVSVTLFMPAMPTMNMPAMRNETKLAAVSPGVYRGAGQVMTGGRWDVTVSVTKNGQRLGSRQFALVAK